MSHKILTEHAEWKALEAKLVDLEREREKGLADHQARVVAYHEGVALALAEEKPLPRAPQSASAIDAEYRAERERADRRRERWLVDHQAELDEASREREEQLLDEVAGAVATLDAAHAELDRLRSMRNSVAYQTNTRSPVTAPQFRPADLIDISRQGRNPLRWDEPAGSAEVAGRELVGQR